MSGCELTELPEEFCLMTKLIELNLSNNQIRKLPDGIGRMTRLTVLNLMFNQLPELPMSLGFCVGLGKLGSGCSIANNPIENPDMWRKYQMGTDHLFDYLEKRLAMFGEDNIEFPPVSIPPELQSEDSSRNLRAANSSPQIAYSPQQQYSQPEPQAQQRQQYAQARKPAPKSDLADDLTTKTVVLKNWSINYVRGELKPKLVKLGNFVGRSMDLSSVTQVANFVEKMKPEMEKAKVYLQTLPPPRNPPTDGDKLFVMKYAVQAVIDDINYMVGVFFGTLQQTSDVTVILGIVGFCKELKRELGYLQIAY